MGCLMIILMPVAFFLSWLMWGIAGTALMMLVVLIPFLAVESIYALTIYNLSNAVGKKSGPLAFILQLPFSLLHLAATVWGYIQVFLMNYITFGGHQARLSAEQIAYFPLLQLYVEHMRWFWGGADMWFGLMPYQNGVWTPVGTKLTVGFALCKMICLFAPGSGMYLVPLLPIFWTLLRPVKASWSNLPALFVRK